MARTHAPGLDGGRLNFVRYGAKGKELQNVKLTFPQGGTISMGGARMPVSAGREVNYKGPEIVIEGDVTVNGNVSHYSQQPRAWLSVCNALNEVVPGWNQKPLTGRECAVAAIKELGAARKTLQRMGYTYHGGQEWKPPLGKAPEYITAEPLPFDLEAAKSGAPLVTRDGRNARFVAHLPDAEYPNARVVVFIEKMPETRAEDGRVFPNEESSRDLFMAPKPKRTMFANIEMGSGLDKTGMVWLHESEEDARRVAGQCRMIDYSAIAVPVEIDA